MLLLLFNFQFQVKSRKNIGCMAWGVCVRPMGQSDYAATRKREYEWKNRNIILFRIRSIHTAGAAEADRLSHRKRDGPLLGPHSSNHLQQDTDLSVTLHGFTSQSCRVLEKSYYKLKESKFGNFFFLFSSLMSDFVTVKSQWSHRMFS